MARYKCPSCGAAYNGRKCRECNYEHFTEEIAHGNHVHEGEPLVIDAPVRRPVKPKDPLDCDRRTKKKRKISPALIIALIAMLNPLLGLIFEAVESFDNAVSFGTVAREPEPYIPEDALLYLGGTSDIAVLADWKDGQEFGDGFDIYVQNDSPQDIAVTARDITVNGWLLDHSFFYCDVYKNGIGKSQFYLDDLDLKHTGIRDVQEISFWLDIYETEDYETLAETEVITLTASVPADAVLYTEPQGAVVYEEDGIRVLYQGYEPDQWDPETFSEGTVLFYLENNTGRYLQIYNSGAYIAGEYTNVSLWCELAPGIRTVATGYLYSTENLEITSPEEAGDLELQLEISDRNDPAFFRQPEPVTLPIA